MIVLDTNVLSELMRPKPLPRVVHWLAACPPSSLFTTSITQAEIFFGLRLLPASKRRASLEAAATELFQEDFRGRVLSFGSDAALFFAQIAAERRHLGQPISQSDAQIAAIALSGGARLATRNVTDFQNCGLILLDPWSAP